MLILSRLAGESIVLESASGEKARVVVLENRGQQVRLGIAADQSVSIDREEIDWKKKQEANNVEKSEQS